MIYALISIAALTLVFWLLYRAKIMAICPICAAAVITWAGGVVGLYIGASWAEPAWVAVLMGATMGAVAERYGSRYGLAWKIGVVLLGLIAIYMLVNLHLLIGLVMIAILLGITPFKGRKKQQRSDQDKDLFKDCC